MKSKCGHWASLHWSRTKLLHLGGLGQMWGSGREQPGRVVPGLFQQDKPLRCQQTMRCGEPSTPAPLMQERSQSGVYREFAELMTYSSIQILISSIENSVGENTAVTVFADFWISFFRRAPTATFHDSKHNIVHVHFDATRGWLLTSGTDKVIKVGVKRLLLLLYVISPSSPMWLQVCPTWFLPPRDLSLVDLCPIRTKEVLVYEVVAWKGWDKCSL